MQFSSLYLYSLFSLISLISLISLFSQFMFLLWVQCYQVASFNSINFTCYYFCRVHAIKATKKNINVSYNLRCVYVLLSHWTHGFNREGYQIPPVRTSVCNPYILATAFFAKGYYNINVEKWLFEFLQKFLTTSLCLRFKIRLKKVYITYACLRSKRRRKKKRN